MSSKIIGAESEFFAKMAVDAALRVKIENREGKAKCPLGNIHILKSHGRGALDSELVDGFALNCSKASAAMPAEIRAEGGKAVKIAFVDFNIQKHKLQMGIQVVVTDTKEVELIRQREMDITKEKIQRILDAGAQVVLTTKGIDDLCLKYFVEANCIAVRRVTPEDLKRIAKATGGKVVSTMASLEGDSEDGGSAEKFNPEDLGECQQVSDERVGDGNLLYFRGCKVNTACTVVLRGANEFMLDEMDRAFHDSLCVIKRIIESNSLVAGGGAVEAALSIHLEKLANTMGTREQLAISQFADALLIIPRILTVNAAHDATELVARLRVHHNNSQTDDSKKDEKYMGLDLYKGETRDNLACGVVEPALSKIKSLRFACEAAVSIMRIDDMIKLNKHEDPQQQGRR
jgi:T-complex protein 1 subunit alpha